MLMSYYTTLPEWLYKQKDSDDKCGYGFREN